MTNRKATKKEPKRQKEPPVATDLDTSLLAAIAGRSLLRKSSNRRVCPFQVSV